MLRRDESTSWRGKFPAAKRLGFLRDTEAVLCHNGYMGRNNADFAGGAGTPEPTESAARGWSFDQLAPTEDFKGEPTVVGMVPTHVVSKYVEVDRTKTAQDHINNLAKDMAENGVQQPLQIEYDHDNSWGTLVEGNHRAAAAVQAGISHLPVVVTTRPNVGTPKDKKGAPLHLKAGKMPQLPSGVARPEPHFRQSHPAAFQELS